MTSLSSLISRLQQRYVAVMYPTGPLPSLEELAQDCKEAAEALRKRQKPKFLDDGFGNKWQKCMSDDCALEIVRPGKVQCLKCYPGTAEGQG